MEWEHLSTTVTESMRKEKKGKATKLSTFYTYKLLTFKFVIGNNSIWKQPKILQKHGDYDIF